MMLNTISRQFNIPNSLSFDNRIKCVWIIGLIASCCFSDAWELPYLRNKVEPPEILFLLFSLWLALKSNFVKSLEHGSRHPLFIPIFIFVCINWISYIFNPSWSSFLECLGFTYLLISSSLISSLFIEAKTINWVPFLHKISEFCLLILFLQSIISLISHYFFSYSYFVLFFDDYPYFGDTVRIKGLVTNSGALMSVLSIFYFSYLGTRKQRRFDKKTLLYTILFFIFGFFTYSKTLFLTSSLFIFSFIFTIPKFPNWLKSVFSIGMAGAFAFLTMFVIQRNDPSLEPPRYLPIDRENAITTKSLTLYPTAYYFLYKSSIYFLSTRPLTGVGTGNYLDEVRKLKKENIRYPRHIPAYEPHDNYLGWAAGTGLIGLIFLVWFLKLLFGKINLGFRGVNKDPLICYATLFIIYLLSEGLMTNSLSFRHIWWIGIIAYPLFIQRLSSKKAI